MAQNNFLDEHVGKINGLTFRKLIDKLNSDVYGRDMRKDISDSVEALGSAITELHDGGSGSGVGWTDYQIGQLEKILKAAAYADTGIGDEINKLIASLRQVAVLTSLNIQNGNNVTLNAGDSLDSIKNVIKVYAVYDAGVPKEVNQYEINGTLIPGKDCPVSISYTEDDITVTSTIIVTVRRRVPVGISARFFGNQNSLFIGTTADEIKNGVYVYVTYDNGDQERTTDFTLYGDPVVTGMNYWSVKLNSDTTIGSNLRFTGIDPESDPDIMAISAATIDYLLEGCSSTYTNNYIETGRTFSTTITPDRGAIGSVSVFVDGRDHPEMINGGIITINSIYIKNRSRIVISAINSDTCTVSYYLTNCTSSNTEESVSYRGGYSTVIIPNDGYELDLEKTYIIMGSNKNQTSNGTFSIAEVTDNIKVYGVAKPASGGEVTLTSISASYTGGTVAAGTTLDQLKNHLTVTAHYSDGSTAPVTDYSLSGTLTAGRTNTITVTYQGKTATFSVTVEAEESENPTIENGAFSFTYTYGATASADAKELFTENQIGTIVYGDIGSLLGRNHMITQTFPYLTTKKYVLNVQAIQYSAHVQFIAFDSGLNLIGYSPYGNNSYGACTTGTFDFTVQGGSLTNTAHPGDVWTIPDGTVYLAVFGRTRGIINSSSNLVNGESKYLKFAMTVSDA